jgi:hypothetical protein
MRSTLTGRLLAHKSASSRDLTQGGARALQHVLAGQIASSPTVARRRKRTVSGQGVAGSNPVSPTDQTSSDLRKRGDRGGYCFELSRGVVTSCSFARIRPLTSANAGRPGCFGGGGCCWTFTGRKRSASVEPGLLVSPGFCMGFGSGRGKGRALGTPRGRLCAAPAINLLGPRRWPILGDAHESCSRDTPRVRPGWTTSDGPRTKGPPVSIRHGD